MFTMRYDIKVGDYRLGMLEKVEINRSVELLADTAVITLPAAEYNAALDVESKIRRGDRVVECARLENEYAFKGHRRFESAFLRQIKNKRNFSCFFMHFT